MIAGDFVTTEDGTGLVHIAPAFGEDDYRARRRAGLFDPTVREHALQPGPCPTANSMTESSASPALRERTPRRPRSSSPTSKSRGLLFREQVYEHAYPHCWRCGTPLLYYATSSWYIATSQAAIELLANNETIGWHPEHVKHGRFGKWLENNVDWALSRNRYWGTPLPIWGCSERELRRASSASAPWTNCASTGRRRCPRRPAPPLHRRSDGCSARAAGRRCAGRAR